MLVIAGPCVIESEVLALGVAHKIARIAERLGIEIIYKSSFDKANRSSPLTPRGPGIEEGLRILSKVASETGLRTITDIHETSQVDRASDAVDLLQIPAFLCRQTDLIKAAVASGRPVLVKKGQFMAPREMAGVVAKAREALDPTILIGERLILCERGTSFGYHDLVVDMRSLEILREFDCPVFFDASHSVQQPGAGNSQSSGRREFTPVLARAAAAVGIDGLFVETHPNPQAAHSDADTVWPLDRLEELLEPVLEINQLAVLADDHKPARLAALG